MKDTRKSIKLDNIRVASPCHVSWESMHGDERVRHCDSCRLNVYNVSAMTADDARELIENRDGRLCIRLYRRADGTVLTLDCPIGLRKYRKRIGRLAGAALTAILGLFSVSYGQKSKTIDAKDLKISTTAVKRDDGRSVLRGKVADANGAVIPNSKVSLLGKKDKKVFSTRGNEDGEFFIAAPAGVYTLVVEFGGFAPTKFRNLVLSPDSETEVDAVMLLPNVEVVVGIFEESDEFSSAGGTTTLSSGSQLV